MARDGRRLTLDASRPRHGDSRCCERARDVGVLRRRCVEARAAIATLGSATLIVATLILVGWARGVVVLPRLDGAALVAALAACALVAWTALTVWWSIAGDRSFDALGKGLVLLAFGVVGLAAAVRPGRPVRAVALVLAAALGAVLCWALLGKIVPALGPDDAGRVTRLRGIGRLLERTRASRRRCSRPRALARRDACVIASGVRSAHCFSTSRRSQSSSRSLARDSSRDSRSSHSCSFSRRAESRRLLFALLACGPGPSRRRLGLHTTRARRGRCRLGPACLERREARRVGRAGRCGRTRRREQGARRATRRDSPPSRRAHPGLRRGDPVRRRAARSRGGGRKPGHVGREPAHELERGRQRSRPSRGVRHERPVGLVGRGMADLPRESGGAVPAPPRSRSRASACETRAQPVSSPHSVPLQLLSETGLPGFVLGLAFVVAASLSGFRRRSVGSRGDERGGGRRVSSPCRSPSASTRSSTRPRLPRCRGTDHAGLGRRFSEPARPACPLGQEARSSPGIVAAALARSGCWWPPRSRRASVERTYGRQITAGKLDAAASAARRAQRLNPLAPDPL